MTITLTIILAIILDYRLGEPKRYHPLVGFGWLANNLESRLCHPEHSPARQKLLGMLAWALLTLPLPLLMLSFHLPATTELTVNSLVLYLCIAPSSLKQHANRVYQALQTQPIEQARAAVGYMVSRNTDQMDVRQIQNAAIESVLENGADAVFAPLFWFVLAGPAGVIFYRLSNTLDAMWGYKNARYRFFGRFAARMDDSLNYIPARLTALSYALMGQTRLALSCWKMQARLLESPNAGPVMTSGAGALNRQLGGPAVYHGRFRQKPWFGSQHLTQSDDIVKANQLVERSLLCWCVVIAIGDYFA
ncbi:adenosylcobinamide-phosphate synthase CbiB [methane-oxidizing endosymbiont of Gigantopelta aegis]|uniref:adenosylcobinamide-phosphate synthase CbiB n=1 Tax=methane-oxidizing endosymbiont of Gigantopelta aegis TaxID=2794938 RepID=UPI0018DD4B98|nr:adenosylcobinamide-phosphate synthase CbiB [methane-oxidizing endosymbiont of Gigantopelta aegis]